MNLRLQPGGLRGARRMLPLLAVRLGHTAAAEARQEQGMVNLAFDRDGSRTSNIDLTGTVPAIRPFAGVSVRF